MSSVDIRHRKYLQGTKALLTIILLLAFAGEAMAQLNYLDYRNKKMYFGITMGLNFSKFKVSQSEEFITNDSILVIRSPFRPGFNLGIISNLKLSEYFDLRFIPTLSFADKQLSYDQTNPKTINKNIESIFIELPVSVRFKSQPIKDVRVYVMTGLRYNIDLASNAKARLADDQVKINRNDVSAEYGLGLQLFFPLFIFSPEIKFGHGLFDIHAPNRNLVYSNVLNRLINRTIIISFHFEG